MAVFDIKMPRMDGMELLRELRKHSDLPVIFLTSKDDEQDEEAGLEMGADDYIAKPFSLRLLLARIRAILRRLPGGLAQETGNAGVGSEARTGQYRTRQAGHGPGPPSGQLGRRAGIPDGDRISDPGSAGHPSRRHKIRNQLMDAAYPDDMFVDDRTVDSHIKRLRRKFRAVDDDFASIETLYGAGYSFTDG